MLVTLEDIRPGQLAQKLLRGDISLFVDPITEGFIRAYLTPEDHTYAIISSHTEREIVKISLLCQGTVTSLALERGLGVAPPASFPPGSCISFELTRPAVLELANCEGGAP